MSEPRRPCCSTGTTGAVLAVVIVAAAGIACSCHRSASAGKTKTTAKEAAAKPAQRPRLPRIDAHTHIGALGLGRALGIMSEWGIDGMVNLSGGTPGSPRHSLESQIEIARASGGRIAVFANVNFIKTVRTRRDYGKALAEELKAAKGMGAIGLKISKGLGLGYPAPGEKTVLPVDDPGLDPLFEMAGKLDMPVSIHTGDPKAFWQPPDEKNERIDELRAHPEWLFYAEPVPPWAELYAQFERRVARHPKTTFIGVHFGNAPEEPERVGRMLDKYPNLVIDTAARVPEIGRQDATKMRQFFEKYQDRILFGTDLGVGPTQDDMMYGSTGSEAPTLADEKRFFASTWRYFETSDKQFESPTPIQGRWKIDGIGLSELVLRKLYFENAARLLKWRPPIGHPAPAQPTAPPLPASPPPPPSALAK